jgi:hypothetical protein
MADFERSTTVGVGADAAFAFLSDPRRVPDYVTAMHFDEAIAVDGDPEAEIDDAEIRPVGEARFLADAAARRVEWGMADRDYGGSATVTAGTASTSQVTLRLHVRDDADTAEIERLLDQTVRNLQRLLSGR